MSNSETPTIAKHETELDINRIMQIIPHRYPFLLIDRVINIPSDTELTAIKNVTINEQCFLGHFPKKPVFPGVLQIEVMTQAAGLLVLRHVSNVGKIALFMSVNNFKFRKAVYPGDQIIVHVRLKKMRGTKIAIAEGELTVDGQIVSSGEVMFTTANVTDTD